MEIKCPSCGDELVVDFEWPSEEQVIKMSSGDFAAIVWALEMINGIKKRRAEK